MKISTFLCLGAPLVAYAAASWLAVSAGADPLPRPAQASRSVPEGLFPVPLPPVNVQSADAPLPGAGGEGDCPVCTCPPECVRGPLRRLYHYHTKPALQLSHWGCADLFHERPFGSYVLAAAGAQIENGLVAQMVLYRYDFVTPEGLPGAELNPSGLIRLEKVASLAQMLPCPIVIEVDPANPQINAARRASVLALLRRLDPGFTDEQVVIGRDRTRPLAAEEGVATYGNVQTQVQTMGGMPSYSGGRMSGIGSGVTGASGGGQRPASGN